MKYVKDFPFNQNMTQIKSTYVIDAVKKKSVKTKDFIDNN